MRPSQTTLFGAVVAATVVIVGAPAAADAQSYYNGARPSSMGGAYTSVATGPSGLYHNPAGIPMARMYAVSGGYQFHASRSAFNATVADSKTNPKITAAAGYSYLLPHGDADGPSGHDIRLGIAVPAIERRFSVGVGGRYMILQNQNGVEYARGLTLDGGLIVRILRDLHVGITGRNLLNICDRPVRCRGVASRTLAAGVSYGRSTAFQVAGDFEMDLNSEADDLNFEFQVGGEYLFGGMIPVRLGYRHETLDASHHITGGAGWRSKKYGLDASVDFNVLELSEFEATASVAIYFD